MNRRDISSGEYIHIRRKISKLLRSVKRNEGSRSTSLSAKNATDISNWDKTGAAIN